MKKLIAGLTLALMVAALPLSLVGCKKTSIYGTWKLYAIKYELSGEVSEDDKTAFAGYEATQTERIKNGELAMTLEVKKDKTFLLTWTEGDGTETYPGTWKKEGKVYVIEVAVSEDHTETIKCTISKGKLKLLMNQEEEGNEIIECYYLFKK